ncbi:hypothetical protein Poli38472_010628 [Pythium oligandrum]|uniref:Polycystin domain-containing protein n=1 Tax=Pythium oligandrum TaxID=41045 RepID=A0A8K1C3C4_PYTOL|nr:hypothetical protein Poli38472_010628 [Pythium oligandrum]|eukprot:TMW55746.1 hypothetical protein Poli38472_010628 [Pythium oligandrum]
MQLGEDSDLLPAARSTPLLTADEILELARHDATVCLQRWWKRRRHHNHQRIAELREQLCRYATSLIEKRRQSRIRAKIRDIVIHLVFLYVYTVSTHHGYTGEQLFRLIQAVRTSYSRESAQRFSDISSQADLFTWLNGPFLEATYVSPPPLLSRVGGVRIGQLRVTRSNCSSRAASFFPTALNVSSGADFYCYGADSGAFDTENENTAAFGGTTGSSFPFLGLNDTNADTEREEYFSSMQTPTNTDQSYPAPAYSVVLPRSDVSQAREVLSWLRHDAYVDAYTRTVMIDVNLYSIMLRHALAVRFLVEFLPPSGDGAVTSQSTPCH